MSRATTPAGVAAWTKVVLDAVQTVFGAVVVVLTFFGISMVLLASGLGNLGPELRAMLIERFMWVMVVMLALLVIVRIFKPSGLAGPPRPTTEGLKIKNSEF